MEILGDWQAVLDSFKVDLVLFGMCSLYIDWYIFGMSEMYSVGALRGRMGSRSLEDIRK